MWKSVKIEYRLIFIKYRLKGLTGKEIYDGMSKTLSEVCPSYATVKNWIASFKQGKVSNEDDDRPGRPISVSTVENVDAVHDMILSYHRISIEQVSETLKNSCERVHHIIHADLDMKQISAKWIPKCLNTDQKRARVETSRSSCALFNESPEFLIHVLTMDETWLYFYDPETKQ